MTTAQRPIHGVLASRVPDLFAIIKHPAFRLGFLDARAGRPIDHDAIRTRIFHETPPGALERLGYSTEGMLTSHQIDIAQFRYEEGREMWIRFRPRVRAWGHPDFPPKAICDLCFDFARERSAPA